MQLNEVQQNLVKDILKVIGGDDVLNAQVATAVGLSEDEFNAQSDAIFLALGNGRVTFEA